MYEIPRIRRRSRFATVARKLGGGVSGLHVCIVCGSDCICPIQWEADGDEHWLITLHCPECDVWRDVRATNAEAKTFDLALDAQMRSIERVLAKLDHEQMRAEADRFVAALELDLIEPADFAGR
jgi:hypothetical protein